MLCRCFSRGR
uniref:Uncharacterized protein n=1 Tax=Rhizophora mucronata TaxID=61149 RepID=A0A2P2JGR3_RHIMU